jgi:hypothetical protein
VGGKGGAHKVGGKTGIRGVCGINLCPEQ